MLNPNSGPVRWLKKTLPALLVFLLAATAGADDGQEGGRPGACEAPLPDLARATELEPFCERNPVFLHRFGQLLNAAQRFADAAERLEAALLFDPERWSVQVDFAVALEGLGDLASADGLWAALAENPAAQAWLAERQIRRDSARSAWLNNERNTLGVSIGYDNNLLGATRYTSLNLTFPTADVPVVIVKSEQQRGGRVVRVDLDRGGDLYADAESRWSYAVVASHSASIDYRQGNLSHLGARLERAPEGAQGWYASSVLQYQYRGTRASTVQTHLGGGYEQDAGLPGLRCRLRVGGEAYATHYPDNAVFDGRYTGLLVHGVCPAARIQYQIRAGQDAPTDDDRPGGTQRHYGARLTYVTPFVGGWLSAEVDFFRQIDRQGYSPLLENNTRRSLSRTIGRLEYRWVRADYAPYIGVEWMDQRSSLPLFEPRNWIVTVGIRHAW